LERVLSALNSSATSTTSATSAAAAAAAASVSNQEGVVVGGYGRNGGDGGQGSGVSGNDEATNTSTATPTTAGMPRYEDLFLGLSEDQGGGGGGGVGENEEESEEADFASQIAGPSVLHHLTQMHLRAQRCRILTSLDPAPPLCMADRTVVLTETSDKRTLEGSSGGGGGGLGDPNDSAAMGRWRKLTRPIVQQLLPLTLPTRSDMGIQASNSGCGKEEKEEKEEKGDDAGDAFWKRAFAREGSEKWATALQHMLLGSSSSAPHIVPFQTTAEARQLRLVPPLPLNPAHPIFRHFSALKETTTTTTHVEKGEGEKKHKTATEKKEKEKGATLLGEQLKSKTSQQDDADRVAVRALVQDGRRLRALLLKEEEEEEEEEPTTTTTTTTTTSKFVQSLKAIPTADRPAFVRLHANLIHGMSALLLKALNLEMSLLSKSATSSPSASSSNVPSSLPQEAAAVTAAAAAAVDAEDGGASAAAAESFSASQILQQQIDELEGSSSSGRESGAFHSSSKRKSAREQIQELRNELQQLEAATAHRALLGSSSSSSSSSNSGGGTSSNGYSSGGDSGWCVSDSSVRFVLEQLLGNLAAEPSALLSWAFLFSEVVRTSDDGHDINDAVDDDVDDGKDRNTDAGLKRSSSSSDDDDDKEEEQQSQWPSAAMADHFSSTLCSPLFWRQVAGCLSKLGHMLLFGATGQSSVADGSEVRRRKKKKNMV
jgi:hypothetical protein